MLGSEEGRWQKPDMAVGRYGKHSFWFVCVWLVSCNEEGKRLIDRQKHSQARCSQQNIQHIQHNKGVLYCPFYLPTVLSTLV